MTVKADHSHDTITAIDPNKKPAAFMLAFFNHVRDDHGLNVTRTTPWAEVEQMHQADHG